MLFRSDTAATPGFVNELRATRPATGSLTVDLGDGDDAFKIGTLSAFSGGVTVRGGGGNDELTVDNGVNHVWNITSTNAGNVTGIGLQFSSVEGLVGGAQDDTFTFAGNTAGVANVLASTTVVNDSADTIQFVAPHGMVDGQLVRYVSDQVAQTSSLLVNETYYVVVLDDRTIRLSTLPDLSDTVALSAATWGDANSRSEEHTSELQSH